jgi:hypothetical protein
MRQTGHDGHMARLVQAAARARVITIRATYREFALSISLSSLPPQSYFARISGLAASVQTRTAAVSGGDTSDAAVSKAASTTVSISAAAEQAAKNDAAARLKLPSTSSWMRKEFPDDILAEAKARLAERQAAPGIGDGYLPNSISRLPLLPENQALLNQFRQEMKAIGNSSDPEQNARFNQLLNLSLRVQIEGWKAPMQESDVQRELDIQQAMAVVDAEHPTANAATTSDAQPAPMAGWTLRWQQEKLTMPDVEPTIGKSFWLQLADKAGISQDEFMTKARDLAAQFKGNALTQALEIFISDQYIASRAAAVSAS